MMRMIAAAILLTCCTAQAFDVNRTDYGGQVFSYEARLGRVGRIGPVECDSSCTLYLARAQCIHPDASFGFHAPWYGYPDGGVVDQRMVARFANHYRPGLREAFLNHVHHYGAHAPQPMMRLTGRQLVQYGYRLCE